MEERKRYNKEIRTLFHYNQFAVVDTQLTALGLRVYVVAHFSLSAIHKECLYSSGDINRLKMMILIRN
jgi:peptidoglycan biosynthesis protein MviN/MurJ (putative lipid II flippase)